MILIVSSGALELIGKNNHFYTFTYTLAKRGVYSKNTTYHTPIKKKPMSHNFEKDG